MKRFGSLRDTVTRERKRERWRRFDDTLHARDVVVVFWMFVAGKDLLKVFRGFEGSKV